MRPLRLFVFLAAAAAVLPASAQDRDTSGTQLPDIAPREVEIRSTLEIAFPSLERQPLVGFNPPPRVRSINPTRRPFLADYKQESSDLPPSPLPRPEAPDISTLAGEEPLRGDLEAGVGRYYSRFARARFMAPLSQQATFFANIDYEGSEGHEPFDAEPERDTPFNAGEATLGLAFGQSSTTFRFALDGFTTSYTLFGATPRPGADGLDVNPQRQGGGLGASAGLTYRPDTRRLAEIHVRYGGTDYRSEIFEGGRSDARFERAERRLDARGSVRFPAGGLDLTASAEGGTAALDEGALGSDVWHVAGGAGLRFLARRALYLDLGARVLAYAGPGGADGQYVAPDVRLDVYPAPGLDVYVQNAPRIDAHALADLFRDNPYLVAEPRQVPTALPIDAEGGLNYFAGPVQVGIHAGYQRSPNHLYYVVSPDAPLLGNLFAVEYDAAEVLLAGGDVSVVLPRGLHATLGVTVREGRLRDQDVALPYFAPIVGEAMVSYSFAGRRGLVQLVSTYLSPRYLDTTESGQTSDYLDLDLYAAYNVTPAIGLVGQVNNLSGANVLERWDGYPEPPLTVMLGVRVLW